MLLVMMHVNLGVVHEMSFVTLNALSEQLNNTNSDPLFEPVIRQLSSMRIPAVNELQLIIL